jgi:Carboxypeptidase regulatory-like domain
VTELGSKKPLAASMRLQRIEPRSKGGYDYHLVAKASADGGGRWVVKKASAGWYRLIVEADGFVPRVAGYTQFDSQPQWLAFNCELSPSAPVSGRVIDEAGRPLAGAELRLVNVSPATGGRYDSPDENAFSTAGDGRFRLVQVPQGKATIWMRKHGYCRPGLGLEIATPKDGVEITMMRSASVRVTVEFGGKARPGAYIVNMESEGGSKVGSYGGSGTIDAQNQFRFDDVPPGKYVVTGHPNPSSTNDKTRPLAIDLKGGQASEVTLKSK